MEVRVALLEQAAKNQAEELREIRNTLRQFMWIGVGAVVSGATSTILLALNIVLEQS